MNSDRSLLNHHAQSLFVFDKANDLLLINDWHADRPAPLFYLGRSEQETLCCFHSSVAISVRDEIRHYVNQEPQKPTDPPAYAAQYESILSSSHSEGVSLERWSGPAYCFLKGESNKQSVLGSHANIVKVDPKHSQALTPRMSAWLPDIPYEQPMLAWLEEGIAVAICASVRSTPQAMAAGVEVDPEFRRRGIALQLVRAWSAAVMATGRVAMYSTSDDNDASQRVAKSLQLTRIGSDFHVSLAAT